MLPATCSLLFSTGYAFCSFFFGYLVLTIYFGAIAILPLVLYFFLEFIDKKERLIPFILSAAALIYINYHMGFMLVIFLVILYISRIIADAGAAKRLGLLALSGITPHGPVAYRREDYDRCRLRGIQTVSDERSVCGPVCRMFQE